MDDLTRLAVDLEASGHKAYVAARGVVAKGANNVKEDWRRRWSGHPTAPALPAAITYDTRDGFTGPTAEIGPDKGKRQGPLGSLFEYGSVNNAPIPGGAPALDLEAPKFEKALADVAERLL